MYRSLYVQPIRKAMRDVGYDLCLGCGYELRGLGSDIRCCPECGAERESLTASYVGLHAQGPIRCGQCGYDLRGASPASTRCPECGFQGLLDLPRMKWPIDDPHWRDGGPVA